MLYYMKFWNPDISEIRTLFGRDCPDLGGSSVLYSQSETTGVN